MDNPRALVMRHDPASRQVQFNDKADRIREALGLRAAGLRAVSGSHQEQDRERGSGVHLVRNRA